MSKLAAVFLAQPVRNAVQHLFDERALEAAARLLCNDLNMRRRLRPSDRLYRTPCKVSTSTGIEYGQVLSQVLGLLYQEVARRARTRAAILDIVDSLTAQPRDIVELFVVRDLITRVGVSDDSESI